MGRTEAPVHGVREEVPGTKRAGPGRDRIPAAVLDHLKRCLLDSLGCGLFGARQPCGRITADYALAQSGGGAATLRGGGDRCGPADVA